MAKIRVHQLAKELGIDSKVIIAEAEKHGIAVKNHMSSLSDSDEFMLRAFLEELRPIVKAPEPPPPPPPPPP
ncbi:MAG: translation initiation factor IF-2 N-terminal domain-containing protein, partial [Planctomycetes bacterium]|nr:translation initiation factor IF-2 N-terminal domain-containing protein [Planctomycetota bacterium]